MGIENLGKLEDAELRRAWPHEAHDFTPWLACNLDQLSSEVGINLKYEAQEQVIGNTGLRFDIVARNSVDDSVVLIENQLEDADAGHLGAMMAYLAGLEAHTVIWIAKGFGRIVPIGDSLVERPYDGVLCVLCGSTQAGENWRFAPGADLQGGRKTERMGPSHA